MKMKYILACLLLFTITSTAFAEKAAYIIVSKEEMKMTVYNQKGTELMKFPIACGMNYGQKERAGDNRTPEGVFKVVSKDSASHWTYDFGSGPVKGAYGPLFIRLNTPGFKGIGIHGTHDKSTVPGRETHGCIRLKNEDLVKLSKLVDKGTLVVILPSRTDVLATLSKMEKMPEKLFLFK